MRRLFGFPVGDTTPKPVTTIEASHKKAKGNIGRSGVTLSGVFLGQVNQRLNVVHKMVVYQ